MQIGIVGSEKALTDKAEDPFPRSDNNSPASKKSQKSK
jgi:hypothetical protein